jgi:deoxyribonuclease IV
MPPRLGAHVSIAGGLPLAIGRGVDLGCEALQIFVKNASQWRARALDDSEAAAFREAHGASPIGPLVAHASYLINLAATDADDPRPLPGGAGRRARPLRPAGGRRPGGPSGSAPGDRRGSRDRAGRGLARRGPRGLLPDGPTRVLLENTAGQGTVLGHRNAQLAAIRRASRSPERLGFCLDTCHAFAAGYPVHEPAGLDQWLEEVGEVLGWERVGALHLNDSKQPFDSRRDRHENVGRGAIGQETFSRLLHDPRTAGKPMIVETPLGDDGEGHRRDLELLRSL